MLEPGYLSGPTSPYFGRRYVSIDNIIAALEQRDRVCGKIRYHSTGGWFPNIRDRLGGMIDGLQGVDDR